MHWYSHFDERAGGQGDRDGTHPSAVDLRALTAHKTISRLEHSQARVTSAAEVVCNLEVCNLDERAPLHQLTPTTSLTSDNSGAESPLSHRDSWLRTRSIPARSFRQRLVALLRRMLPASYNAPGDRDALYLQQGGATPSSSGDPA